MQQLSRQAGGDTEVDTIFEGLQEQNRLKLTDEQRFIEVDNQEAVKIGELERNSEAIKLARPKFNKAIFQDATIREGVDDLALRTGESGMLRTFIDTSNVLDGGDHRRWTKMCTNLPGLLQGRRGSGELVLQVCGHEPGGQRPQPR